MPFNVGDRVRAIRDVNNGVRQGDEVVVRIAENHTGRFSFTPTERMRNLNYMGGGYSAQHFELVLVPEDVEGTERYAAFGIDVHGRITFITDSIGSQDWARHIGNVSRHTTFHIVPLRAIESVIDGVSPVHTEAS